MPPSRRTSAQTGTLTGTVIPAKAGIQSVGGACPTACGVDSRLRGTYRCSEVDPLPNDAITVVRNDRFLEPGLL